MKNILIFLTSLLSLSTANSEPSISRWDQRNPQEVILSLDGRQVRYIEEASCRQGSTPRPPSSSQCLLIPKDNHLESISNAHGQIRTRPAGVDALNFIQATVSSGFCSIPRNIYCTSHSTQTEYYPACSPSIDTSLKLKIDGITVAGALSPSVCNFTSGIQKFGQADYREYIESRRRMLQQFCVVIDI